ncbi:hypothetical protein Tco_0019837 [Tanacetum coccineum]
MTSSTEEGSGRILSHMRSFKEGFWALNNAQRKGDCLWITPLKIYEKNYTTQDLELGAVLSDTGPIRVRYVGLFKVLGKVGEVAYKLELPEELSRVHNTFHVSNLKKYYADELLAVLLDGLYFDDKLQFMEEPVEIMDREVKRLKQIRMSINPRV